MILDNFPLVLWINLDKSIERRKYMEKLLGEHNINNIRITGIDGTNSDQLELNNICISNENLNPAENACTCSHITALKYFIENTDQSNVIIFEDDVSFDFLQFIPYNWSDFTNHLPCNYDVIQLALTQGRSPVQPFLVKSNAYVQFYCSVAYLITREGARKILDKYISKENNKIDLSVQRYATADSMITRTGHTYSIPIFTYKIEESIIHPMHLLIHQQAKNAQYQLWRKIADVKDKFIVEEYFNKFPKN